MGPANRLLSRRLHAIAERQEALQYVALACLAISRDARQYAQSG
jgi:hypothetical protein